MLTKVCTKCNVEKTVDCFYKQDGGKFGVTASCRECLLRYYQDNKESSLLRNKRYYEKNREKKKQYAQINRDAISSRMKEYRERNSQHIASRLRKWRQDNPDKVNAHASQYRASKLQSTPSWADKDAIAGMYQLATIFNRTGLNLHVDHVVPLNSDTVCGLHCEANLQLLPASDNISKGNRHWPDMW